mgnify:CR=1 FL=1|tara:strand:+ start:2082 stop:4040 length:1959 start_codon:yes stop_codon:yes gene_type:complete
MATADEYAAWIVKNADKKGTPEFDTVAAAYKDARQSMTAAPAAPSEIPAPRREPTMSERVMGTPAMRVALGAATPIVGAFQAGANVGDVIAEKMGYTPTVGKSVSDWWNNIQAMKEKGMEVAGLPSGTANPDVMGLAGTGAVGLAGLAKSGATTTGQKVLEGGKLGAVFGAATPGIDTAEKTATAAALGAAIGGAAPVLIPAAAKAAGWIWDTASGKLVQMKAGKILREISGPELDAIRTATAQAAPGRTAAQAVQEAGVIAPVFQAMGEKGATLSPEFASAAAQRAIAEETARKATLTKVTPNLKAAINARDLASDPLYEAAKKQVVTLDEPFLDLFGRMPKGTVEKAADIARMEKRPFQMGQYVPEHQIETGVLDAAGKPIMKTVPAELPKITGDSLHYLKRALSDIANAPPSAQGAGRDTQNAARGVLKDFLAKFETSVPKYGEARQTFAKGSQPVNQAQVLNEMLSVLEKPGGGERVTPFLNALGRGENALLKRSTGFARYEGLGDVLTQPQMGAVGKIAGEMERDVAMSKLATEGSPALTKLLNQDTAPFKMPSYLSWVQTTLNAVSNRLQGRVSDKTLTMLAKGMQTGKGANDLLNAIPASERNIVLKTMVDSKAWDPAVLSVIGAKSGNSLAPNSQSQNALAESP